MRNEKGITLVELLATLAIAGIIIALIASVLTSGSNASQRTGLNQRLQQEGNIVVEKIRAQYLMNQQDDSIPDKFEIAIKNDKLIFTDEMGNTEIISEGYSYDLDPSAAVSSPSKQITILDRTKKSEFNLIIRAKSNEGAEEQEYKINTTFSKIH